MSGFGMGIGWIILLLFVGVVTYFFFNQKKINGNPGKSAQDILDERYAKGEIDEAEYQHKREELKS